MPEQGQRFTEEGVPIVDESELVEASVTVPASDPEQLTLPGIGVSTEAAGVVEIGGRQPSRSEFIAAECVESGEPFFVLRAKDIFSVMAVHNYSKLVEEYGPMNIEFHGNIGDLVHEMREWQQANPDRVKYPD